MKCHASRSSNERDKEIDRKILFSSLFFIVDGSFHFINIRYQKRLSIVELRRRNVREFPQQGKAIPWHGVKSGESAQLLTPRSLPFYHGRSVVRVPGQFTAEIRDSLGI